MKKYLVIFLTLYLPHLFLGGFFITGHEEFHSLFSSQPVLIIKSKVTNN